MRLHEITDAELQFNLTNMVIASASQAIKREFQSKFIRKKLAQIAHDATISSANAQQNAGTKT